jgi:hypothetical protein
MTAPGRRGAAVKVEGRKKMEERRGEVGTIQNVTAARSKHGAAKSKYFQPPLTVALRYVNMHIED